jgi:hypothetical protein
MRGIRASLFVVVCNAWLPISRAFILREQDILGWIGLHKVLEGFNAGQFLLISRVGTRHVDSASFVVDIQPIQDLPEPGLRLAMKPGTVLQHILKPPARTVDAHLMGITTHHLQKRFFGRFIVLVDRGKSKLAPSSCANP